MSYRPEYKRNLSSTLADRFTGYGINGTKFAFLKDIGHKKMRLNKMEQRATQFIEFKMRTPTGQEISFFAERKGTKYFELYATTDVDVLKPVTVTITKEATIEDILFRAFNFTVNGLFEEVQS